MTQLNLTPKQQALAKKHGTPSEFAIACYKAVPSFISMDEAQVAVEKYNREWNGVPMQDEGGPFLTPDVVEAIARSIEDGSLPLTWREGEGTNSGKVHPTEPWPEPPTWKDIAKIDQPPFFPPAISGGRYPPTGSRGFNNPEDTIHATGREFDFLGEPFDEIVQPFLKDGYTVHQLEYSEETLIIESDEYTRVRIYDHDVKMWLWAAKDRHWYTATLSTTYCHFGWIDQYAGPECIIEIPEYQKLYILNVPVMKSKPSVFNRAGFNKMINLFKRFYKNE